MANPYPSVFNSAENNRTRLFGDITFTDPANQPGGGGGGTVDSVTAGDSSITIGGTAADPTVEVATGGVVNAKLGAAAVTNAKIGALAVDHTQITSGAATNHQVLAADGSGNAAFSDPTGVAAVTAGDTSIVVGGSGTNPTIETATLDVIATDHPPAANWSNNSKKITSVANGSSAQDAAAFGQIPTALPPNGSAGGDLSGTYPNPTVAAIQGVAVSGTPPSSTYVLTASDATHAAWAAASSGFSNPMTTKGDIIIENATPAAARLAIGSAGQELGIASGLPAWVYPPGYEIGYTQITSNVNVTSTTEATGTTIISPGALTFDGGAVLCTFFSPHVVTSSNLAQALVVNLFEGSTQLGRLAITANVTAGTDYTTIISGYYRFTPSAGSHTYTITAWTQDTTGTPFIGAGAGGTGAYVPAYVRFTKV